MAKLPEMTIEAGRQMIRERQDPEQFLTWLQAMMPYWNHEKVREGLLPLMKAGEWDRVGRYYEAIVKRYDTRGRAKDMLGITGIVIWLALIAAAVIGGCVYLYRALTGG